MFSIEIGYGVKDMDAAVKDLRLHRKPSLRSAIEGKHRQFNKKKERRKDNLSIAYGNNVGMLTELFTKQSLTDDGKNGEDEGGKKNGDISERAQLMQLARKMQNNMDKEMDKAKRLRSNKFWEKALKELQETEIRIKQKTAEKEKMKEEKFHKRLAEMKDNIEFTKDIDAYCMIREQGKQRARHHLHNEWNVTVFQEIQKQVKQQLDSVTTTQIEKKRRKMMQEFLNTSNAKFIALDTILPEEYDPLKHRGKNVKIIQTHLDDPTKRDLAKHTHEQQLMLQLNDKMQFIKAQPKFMQPLKTWNQIEATPHGRYSDSDPGDRAENSAPQFRRGSAVPFDHFDTEVDPSITRMQYYPRGKRMGLRPKSKYESPIQHVDHVNSLYPMYADGTPLFPNDSRGRVLRSAPASLTEQKEYNAFPEAPKKEANRTPLADRENSAWIETQTDSMEPSAPHVRFSVPGGASVIVSPSEVPSTPLVPRPPTERPTTRGGEGSEINTNTSVVSESRPVTRGVENGTGMRPGTRGIDRISRPETRDASSSRPVTRDASMSRPVTRDPAAGTGALQGLLPPGVPTFSRHFGVFKSDSTRGFRPQTAPTTT